MYKKISALRTLRKFISLIKRKIVTRREKKMDDEYDIKTNTRLREQIKETDKEIEKEKER